jgi:ABC-type glycerol-3-phosphate transport system substrate-binding protein
MTILMAAALLATACSGETSNSSATTTSVTAPTMTSISAPSAPAEYEQLYEQLASQLDTANNDRRLDGDAGVDTTWGLELLAANGNRGEDLLRPATMDSVRISLDRY